MPTPCSPRSTRPTVPTTFSVVPVGVFLAVLGLTVGLGVLYLVWRLIDRQPPDGDHAPSPSEAAPPEKDEPKPGRMHPSTVIAMVGMALGVMAILFVLLFGPSSPLRL